METKKYSAKDVDRLLADTDKMIAEARADLVSKGVNVDFLAEWLTVEEYCKRFNIKEKQTVLDWIKSGIVPSKHAKIAKEVNNRQMIQALPYHATQTAGS